MKKEIYINEACFTTKIEDSLIVLNTKTGRYLELNESATFIWENIESGYSEEEIALKISKTYDISSESSIESVKKFLREAKEKGIIEFN